VLAEVKRRYPLQEQISVWFGESLLLINSSAAETDWSPGRSMPLISEFSNELHGCLRQQALLGEPIASGWQGGGISCATQSVKVGSGCTPDGLAIRPSSSGLRDLFGRCWTARN
jgi:hypothetical protein